MGNSDSKTVWDDKSATGGIQNTHTRQGLGGLIIYHIHDKEMRKSELNLWIDSILLDIPNNVQKKKKNRTATVFHKASLSLHILFFCGFIIRLRWMDSRLPLSWFPGGWKKAYFCSGADRGLLVWKPPGTPTTLHLSVHSSLHRWLTSSHAYLLIKLQSLSPRRDAVQERRMTTQWKKTAHRWFISLSVFKIAQTLRFLFPWV